MSQINTNTYSLNAKRNLAKNSLGLTSAFERLSSGLRVNSAKDDASGLAVGMQKESTSRTTMVDIRKAQDEISAAQIADGALSVLCDIAIRLKEMVQIKEKTVLETGVLLTEYDAEIAQLEMSAMEIQNRALDAGGTFTYIDITQPNAYLNLPAILEQRVILGATMNNQEFNIQALRVNYENQQAARSRIMDADFAEESSRLSRFKVLQLAGTAMIAQANAVPQNVLSLLR